VARSLQNSWSFLVLDEAAGAGGRNRTGTGFTPRDLSLWSKPHLVPPAVRLFRKELEKQYRFSHLEPIRCGTDFSAPDGVWDLGA
jgi:hypothetical protein